MNKMTTVVAMLLSLMVVFSFSPAMAASKDNKQQVAMEESKAQVSAKVNINTADVEELATIPGIGPKTAEAIVAYRNDNGQFKKVDDLIDVKGIGEKKLEQIRPYVQNI
jgi:competence protein ComEA